MIHTVYFLGHCPKVLFVIKSGGAVFLCLDIKPSYTYQWGHWVVAPPTSQVIMSVADEVGKIASKI